MLDSLAEADVDGDADSDSLLEVVSEVLPEGEALELGVTSDEDETDPLKDALLVGVSD